MKNKREQTSELNLLLFNLIASLLYNIVTSKLNTHLLGKSNLKVLIHLK